MLSGNSGAWLPVAHQWRADTEWHGQFMGAEHLGGKHLQFHLQLARALDATKTTWGRVKTSAPVRYAVALLVCAIVAWVVVDLGVCSHVDVWFGGKMGTWMRDQHVGWKAFRDACNVPQSASIPGTAEFCATAHVQAQDTAGLYFSRLMSAYGGHIYEHLLIIPGCSFFGMLHPVFALLWAIAVVSGLIWFAVNVAWYRELAEQRRLGERMMADATSAAEAIAIRPFAATTAALALPPPPSPLAAAGFRFPITSVEGADDVLHLDTPGARKAKYA
jgi:hypothetical protein